MAKVKIPAWLATSPTQCIGVDSSPGRAFITVAALDKATKGPRHSEKANGGNGGPAKAKRLTPETVEFILDNETKLRAMVSAAKRLNA